MKLKVCARRYSIDEGRGQREHPDFSWIVRRLRRGKGGRVDVGLRHRDSLRDAQLSIMLGLPCPEDPRELDQQQDHEHRAEDQEYRGQFDHSVSFGAGG